MKRFQLKFLTHQFGNFYLFILSPPWVFDLKNLIPGGQKSPSFIGFTEVKGYWRSKITNNSLSTNYGSGNIRILISLIFGGQRFQTNHCSQVSENIGILINIVFGGRRGGSSLLVLLSQEFNDEVIKLHARRACKSTPKASLMQLGVWGALKAPQWGLG